jgi:drug/metabolite transporter (DMT)-like permease
VLAAVLIGERLAGKALGLAVAFAGAVLVVTGGSSLGLPSTRGDLLTVVSTFTWALYTIYGRDFITRHDPSLVTAHVLGFAAMANLPGFLSSTAWQELAQLS